MTFRQLKNWTNKKYWNKMYKTYIRVSRIPFRTSSSHAFLINRLFKHNLMQFKKKNWKLIFKKQCKRAKTIFQPAQGSKWPVWQTIFRISHFQKGKCLQTLICIWIVIYDSKGVGRSSRGFRADHKNGFSSLALVFEH